MFIILFKGVFMKRFFVAPVFALGLLAVGLISCSEQASTKPNFIFKAAPNETSAANIAGEVLTLDQLNQGVEMDLYEAEMKVYEIQMNRIRQVAIEKFMAQDPKSKGLSSDEYLEKHVVTKVKISPKDIDAFIAEKNVPKEHVNEELRGRVQEFLMREKKSEALEIWLAEKTKNSPIEIYIKEPKRPVFDVAVGDAPIWGSADAKVTVVEFSDFQCPFCSKGAEVIKELKDKYGKSIKVAFKHYPLPFHSNAAKAAEAAMCAHEQEATLFWKMHDAMFANQSNLQIEGLKDLASKAGVKNIDGFMDCLTSGKFKARVDADMEQGKALGVKSTPTFFVNGQMVMGAQPLEVFSEIIDTELKK